MTDDERKTLKTIEFAAHLALQDTDPRLRGAALVSIRRLAREALEEEKVGGYDIHEAKSRHPEWFDGYEAPLL